MVENGALEGGLLWALTDNKRLGRRWVTGTLSAVSGAGLAVRGYFGDFWELANRFGDEVHQNS